MNRTPLKRIELLFVLDIIQTIRNSHLDILFQILLQTGNGILSLFPDNSFRVFLFQDSSPYFIMLDLATDAISLQINLPCYQRRLPLNGQFSPMRADEFLMKINHF